MSKKFCNKAKIMYGKDSLNRISFELSRNNSTRVFVLSDSTSMQSGAVGRIKNLFKGSDASATYYIIDVEKWSTTDVVTSAYQKFYDSKCEFIICVGGDGIANIAKAIKVLANVGTSDITQVTNLNVKDNVPLMLIPTSVKSVSYGVGNTSVVDKDNNKLYKLSGSVLCPNYIIIDKRVVTKLSEQIANERILLILGMSLVALSEPLMSISARIFAFTAMDSLKEPLAIDKHRYLGRTGEEIVIATVAAGIGFTGVPKCMLSLMVMHISICKNIEYNEIFFALLGKYLNLFLGRYSTDDINLLGKYLDDDSVFNITDMQDRREYVISKFIKIINELSECIGGVSSLSELGLEESEKSMIIDKVVNSYGSDITSAKVSDIQALMDSAF